jgi:ssDNA-binding Zn-finger/Zn-ribbon topoisomerase 1
MSQTKQVSLTLSKELAERLALLRKFKHRAGDINKLFESALEKEVLSLEDKCKLGKDDWRIAKTCPRCSTGVLTKKTSSKGNEKREFLGCNRYPNCTQTEPLITSHGRKK